MRSSPVSELRDRRPSGSRSGQSAPQARHPASQITFHEAVPKAKEPAPIRERASPGSRLEGGLEVTTVVFAMLGDVDPGEGRGRSTFECDGMPGAFCLLASTHAREGSRPVHCDRFISLCFSRIEEAPGYAPQ